MYAKIAHSRVFLHLYLIRSSNTFVNNMLFKQKLNTREDRVIKAICGSYLGWPDNSWEKQPTINYFGKVSKESSDQPSLTIISQAWEWKWNHDFFFKIADLTCQCDSENASCKVLQDLHSGRWGPVSLQLAPESQKDQGQARVPIHHWYEACIQFQWWAITKRWGEYVC